MKPVGEGAEALVFPTKYAGESALLKARPQKPYRIPELDSRIRSQRTRREAKILRAARAAGVKSAELLEENEAKCELVMRKVKGSLLSRSKSISQAQGRMAGEELGKLHNAGITHGDYSTSNLIASGGNVVVIDFGLGEFTTSAEERATDLLLFEKSIEEEKNYLQLEEAFKQGYASIARDAHETLERLEKIFSRARYASRRQ